MLEKIKYKLYKVNEGYKCKVTPAEIVFLFNITAQDVEAINKCLQDEKTGYYVTR